MLLKKSSLILILSFSLCFIPSTLSAVTLKHALAGSLSLLIQNNPYMEFASFNTNKNTFYAQGINPWIFGDTGLGFSLGLSYGLIFNNFGIFRVEGQFETTGYATGIINVGGGIRALIGKKAYMNIEAYLSFLQTGSSMVLLTDKTNKINAYVGLFGVKTKIAFEIPVNRKLFFAPYFSYTIYPWKVSSVKNILINGKDANMIIDSIQIGLEIGSYL